MYLRPHECAQTKKKESNLLAKTVPEILAKYMCTRTLNSCGQANQNFAGSLVTSLPNWLSTYLQCLREYLHQYPSSTSSTLTIITHHTHLFALSRDLE